MEAIRAFDVHDTAYLRPLTVAQAQAALAHCEAGAAKPTAAQALDMVDALLDFYGHQQWRSKDATKAFAAAAAGLVMEVSLNAARRAFHPMTGLPRQAEFLSVATVSKALQLEEGRFFRIAANARWVLDRAQAAERAAKEAADFEAKQGTAEERAARIAAVMASMRAKGDASVGP